MLGQQRLCTILGQLDIASFERRAYLGFPGGSRLFSQRLDIRVQLQ